jgi:hypothetical protein
VASGILTRFYLGALLIFFIQQLKDKVMAHLEMLIAKGEIRGPPYVMSEDQDFPFLRKFIERQAAGIQHNPRLRGIAPDSRNQSSNSLDMPRSETPEDSKSSIPYVDDSSRKFLRSSKSSDVLIQFFSRRAGRAKYCFVFEYGCPGLNETCVSIAHQLRDQGRSGK